MEIAPAAQRLRSTHVGFTPETTPVARRKILDSFKIHNLAAELIVEVRPRSGSSIQLQSDGGTVFATIAYYEKPGAREMLVNNVRAPLSESNGLPLRLHLLLDGSVMEVFIDKTTSLTARIYQVPSGPLRIKMMGEVEARLVQWLADAANLKESTHLFHVLVTTFEPFAAAVDAGTILLYRAICSNLDAAKHAPVLILPVLPGNRTK